MKILIATNGKNHSEKAIHFAGDLFSVFEPEVTLLFVGQKSIGNITTAVGVEVLKQYNLYVKVNRKIRNGSDISAEIIKETESKEYDFLILGSRGQKSIIPGVSSYILGDIPREVTEKAKISTLIVRGSEKLEKILIAINGSVASEEAANFWGLVTQKNEEKKKNWRDKKVRLLTVVPELYSRFSEELKFLTQEQLSALEKVSNDYTRYSYKVKKNIFQKYNVKSQIRLREGETAEEILKEADRDYDLIILGRDENSKNTFGTHLQDIVEQAKIPILVIRNNLTKK